MTIQPTVDSSTEYPEHFVFNKKRFKEACDLAGVEALDAHYPQWVEEQVENAKQRTEQPDKDAILIDSSKGDDDLVRITNVDVFAAHFVAWHERNKAFVDQVMEVPEGQEVEVKMPDGSSKSIKLEGDNLFAFKTGISVVMSVFGNLPFKAIPKEPENAKPESNG